MTMRRRAKVISATKTATAMIKNGQCPCDCWWKKKKTMMVMILCVIGWFCPNEHHKWTVVAQSSSSSNSITANGGRWTVEIVRPAPTNSAFIVGQPLTLQAQINATVVGDAGDSNNNNNHNTIIALQWQMWYYLDASTPLFFFAQEQQQHQNSSSQLWDAVVTPAAPEPIDYTCMMEGFLRIVLTAIVAREDNTNTTMTMSTNVGPQTVDLTLETVPMGRYVQIFDGVLLFGPTTVSAWKGQTWSMRAPVREDPYRFAAWQHGGPAKQSFVVTEPATYRAIYMLPTTEPIAAPTGTAGNDDHNMVPTVAPISNVVPADPAIGGVAIISPSLGESFVVGQRLTLRGVVLDVHGQSIATDDGNDVSSIVMSWQVRLYVRDEQNDNAYWDLIAPDTKGNNLRTDRIPNPPDVNAIMHGYIQVILTVGSPNAGSSTQVIRQIDPATVSLTLQSMPTPHQLIDLFNGGRMVITPTTVEVWQNQDVNITVPSNSSSLFLFGEWQPAGSTDLTSTVTATAAMTITAVFEALPNTPTVTPTALILPEPNVPTLAPVSQELVAQPPRVVIVAPAPEATFSIGDAFTLQGQAFDADTNTGLPDSSLSWTIGYYTTSSSYTVFMAETVGNNITSPASPAPLDYDTLTTSFLQVALTATDAAGFTTTSVRNVYPLFVPIDIDTNPTGLYIQVMQKQLSVATPFTLNAWNGQVVTLTAPDQPPWLFNSWSNAAPQRQNITADERDNSTAVLLASYVRSETAAVPTVTPSALPTTETHAPTTKTAYPSSMIIPTTIMPSPSMNPSSAPITTTTTTAPASGSVPTLSPSTSGSRDNQDVQKSAAMRLLEWQWCYSYNNDNNLHWNVRPSIPQQCIWWLAWSSLSSSMARMIVPMVVVTAGAMMV